MKNLRDLRMRKQNSTNQFPFDFDLCKKGF